MADPIPNGTAITIAVRVTRRVPATRGTVPYFGMILAGSQQSPVRNGISPISRNAGTASASKNPRMQNIAMMEDMAQRNQMILTPCSTGRCMSRGKRRWRELLIRMPSPSGVLPSLTGCQRLSSLRSS